MNKSLKLQNKVALVTAGNRGIGLASAEKLASEGAIVYIGVRRIEVGEEIATSAKAKGLILKPVYFDGTKEETFAPMIETVIAKEGRLDILVNNFGIGSPMEDFDLVKGSSDAFFHLIKANLGSVYIISKLAVVEMMKNGGGSIVNISSIGGLIPDVSRIGYGVSKAAVNNITQQIAMQFAGSNIRCNAVLPGLTATDAAIENMPKSFLESFLTHVPLNRMGTPEDMANAVLFFASDDSSYITGHILDVAGGYGLGTPQYADTLRSQING